MNTAALDVTKSGVLLVGHGTQDALGTDQFLELGARLAERLSPTPVASSLLEFQRPTIPEAWQSLVRQGVQHVHVAPLLLFAAGHAKDDIPRMIAECQSETPGVSFDQSRPISRHRAIIELVLARVQTTLQRLNAPRDRIAVVMVGRGSHDPCAQADMRVLTEVIAHRLNVARVETAFYAMAKPNVPAVLERLATSGSYDAIAVHPHLLFEGRLYQAILGQTETAATNSPQIQFEASNYLGPDSLVAEAIAARIAQCRSGAYST